MTDGKIPTAIELDMLSHKILQFLDGAKVYGLRVVTIIEHLKDEGVSDGTIFRRVRAMRAMGLIERVPGSRWRPTALISKVIQPPADEPIAPTSQLMAMDPAGLERVEVYWICITDKATKRVVQVMGGPYPTYPSDELVAKVTDGSHPKWARSVMFQAIYLGHDS